jgi:hypothetical protein
MWQEYVKGKFIWMLLGCSLVLNGCQTPNFKPVTNIPPNRALVYFYRKYNYFGSGIAFKLYVNNVPITVIYPDNFYYPYLAMPGQINVAVKQLGEGMFAMGNFMYPSNNLGKFMIEPGKSYYMRLSQSGLDYHTKLTQVDDELGVNQITNCVLAKSIETNLVENVK